MAQSLPIFSLPTSAVQGGSPSCTKYVTTNTTSGTVINVKTNYRDSRGRNLSQYVRSNLRPSEQAQFQICNGSFINVEANPSRNSGT
ncbi:MAG: hypothetical protein HC856_04500 [Pseudanabaena sp. RU_4_16]|nr:hypothetical protein [Pseudanabaena sp. RU_4_16]